MFKPIPVFAPSAAQVAITMYAAMEFTNASPRHHSPRRHGEKQRLRQITQINADSGPVVRSVARCLVTDDDSICAGAGGGDIVLLKELALIVSRIDVHDQVKVL